VAPLLRRLGTCSFSSSSSSSSSSSTVNCLSRLDLRFNRGLSGGLAAFTGRTDDGDFSGLTTLYLRGCAITGDDGLKPLAASGTAPHLMEIDVTGLSQLSGESS
jgi:hypothetical protein